MHHTRTKGVTDGERQGMTTKSGLVKIDSSTRNTEGRKYEKKVC